MSEEEEIEEEGIIEPEFQSEVKPIDTSKKKIVRIYGDKRICTGILTQIEHTACVQWRISQITNGSPIYVDSPGIMKDSVTEIAKREIRQMRCPLRIRRKVFETETEIYVEIWSVNELEKISKCYGPVSNVLEKKSDLPSLKSVLEDL